MDDNWIDKSLFIIFPIYFFFKWIFEILSYMTKGKNIKNAFSKLRESKEYLYFSEFFPHSKAYYRILVAPSGPLLAETNRTTDSCWLFLVLSWP